jgi:hypothetical protein
VLAELRNWGIVPAIRIGDCRGIDAIPAVDEAAARALGATAILDLLDGGRVRSPNRCCARSACSTRKASRPTGARSSATARARRCPTTPFERVRHWRDTSLATAASILPGERVPSPAREAQFRLAFGLAAMPWLGDHRVHGRAPSFPAHSSWPASTARGANPAANLHGR